MPSTKLTVADFVDNFDYYRTHGLTPTGWYAIKNGTTATGWREVKEANKTWFRRIFSRKKSSESTSAALTDLKYSSTPFYKIRNESGTKVTKMLPTITIPNLPREKWWPTKADTDVPKDITIMIFEADGYRLGRDPKFPLRKERVSRTPSPQRSPTTSSLTPSEWIIFKQRLGPWLRSRPSWTSDATALTWTDSEMSSTERNDLSTDLEPDVEEFGWIAPAVSAKESIAGSPREAAWDDNRRIWLMLPPRSGAMMASCLHL